MNELDDRKCPSCRQVLGIMPKRSSKCKFCGQKIFVKKEHIIYPRSLLNSEEAEVHDSLSKLLSHDIDLRYFQKEKEVLRKKFHTPPSDFDVIWTIYNQLTEKYAVEDKIDQLSYIYHDMAFHIAQHNKSYYRLLLNAKQTQLRYFIKIFHKDTISVKIDTLATACSECQKDEDTEMAANIALKQSPLPHKSCTCSPMCSCSYYVSGGW